MLYAHSPLGTKMLASPNANAVCPECRRDVIAKCGAIKIWHWAHERRADCEMWGESETEWHLQWKSRWRPECVEVLIEREGVRHRADVVTPGGIVLEFQHSPISTDEIAEREWFYQNMRWVFDLREPYESDRLGFNRKNNYYTFRWKQPRKHLAYVGSDLFCDFGTSRIFNMKKMYLSSQCRGWGFFLDAQQFIRTYGGAC